MRRRNQRKDNGFGHHREKRSNDCLIPANDTRLSEKWNQSVLRTDIDEEKKKESSANATSQRTEKKKREKERKRKTKNELPERMQRKKAGTMSNSYAIFPSFSLPSNTMEGNSAHMHATHYSTCEIRTHIVSSQLVQVFERKITATRRRCQWC